MGTRLTAGKRIVRLLNTSLGEGVEWTQSEEVTLNLIADSADRVEALKVHLAAELAKPALSRRSVEIAAEIRQLESALRRWSPAWTRTCSARSRPGTSPPPTRDGIAVARLKARGTNVGLRAYLLREAEEFRDFVSHGLVRSPDGGPPVRGPVNPVFYEILSGPVDDLAAGREVLVHRYDLPDDHVERYAGLPGDYLILGTGDVLRPRS